MTKGQPYGLVTSKNGVANYLPLSYVSVQAYIADVSARVILTQRYKNNTSGNDRAQAQYVFPIPVKAAVCAFELEAGDTIIKGEVKDRVQAKKEFDTAVSNQKFAGLMYETSGDVFVISVGAIPPKEDVKVRITYVTELDDDELADEVRFLLPTYIAQRYGAAPSELKSASSASASAKFTIRVDVQMTVNFKVTSSSHLIDYDRPARLGSGSDAPWATTVTLDPSAPVSQTLLDKDFVLSVTAPGREPARCVAEILPKKNSVALSLSLVLNAAWSSRFKDVDEQEFVFLIDRSGSMDEHSRIGFAKNALTVLVSSLFGQDKTTFNIYSFGTKYSSLWGSSQPYNNANVKAAVAHINKMSANMGGTHIKDALEHIFKSRKHGVPTNIIVLTDGEVWKVQDVLDSARSAVSSAGGLESNSYLRIFSLGIGDSASSALCQGLARVGNGLCFMTLKSEDIAGRCTKLLTAAKMPPTADLGNLSIQWNRTGPPAPRDAQQKDQEDADDDDEDPFGSFSNDDLKKAQETMQTKFVLPPPPETQQAPTKVPNLYTFNRAIVSAILSYTTKVPDKVTIVGKYPNGKSFSRPVTVTRLKPPTSSAPPLLHTLAARRLIMELEDGDLTSLNMPAGSQDADLVQEIAQKGTMRLSTMYQVVSKSASFVAVEGAEPITDDLVPGEPNEGNQEDGASQDNDDDDGYIGMNSVVPPALPNFVMRMPVLRLAEVSTGRSIEPIALQPTVSFMSVSQPVQDQAILVPENDPVTAWARIQNIDGSFELDDKLCALLHNRTLTVSKLKNALPSSLKEVRNAEAVWATCIAAAYMKFKLPGSKDVWQGLWAKARQFVVDTPLVGPYIFTELMEVAARLL